MTKIMYVARGSHLLRCDRHKNARHATEVRETEVGDWTNCWFCLRSDPLDYNYWDEAEAERDFEDEDYDDDSGMVGSMMEAVLAHYEKGKCRQCNNHMEEKPPAESYCSQTCKDQWQQLFDARIKIGLNDLKTRGYD